jgi:hypothetical protein
MKSSGSRSGLGHHVSLGPTPKKRKVNDADSDDEDGIDDKIQITDRFRAQIEAIASLKSTTQGSSKKSLDDSLSKVYEKLKHEVKSTEKSAKEKLNTFLRDSQMDFDAIDMNDRSLKGESALTKKSLKECKEELTTISSRIAGVFTVSKALTEAKAKDVNGSTAQSAAFESKIIQDFEKKADKAHKKTKEAFEEVNIIAKAAR